MPSPSLLEMCSASLSSLYNRVMSGDAKSGVLTVPARMLEVQALDGRKPGDKWKSFNAIVNAIVQKVKEGGELRWDLVSPGLLPLVRVNVALKLHLVELLAESLRSEDASVSRRALNARWFFDGANPHVRADYFSKDILPLTSVKTRLAISKKLARGLRGHEAKAREFFQVLVDLYAVAQVLPILTACSNDFIWDSITRYRIALPTRILKIFWRSAREDLVVRYLRTYPETNEYEAFMNKLIDHRPLDFIALHQLSAGKQLAILNCRRSTWLLRHAKYDVINKPHVFLKLLQPKVVENKLSSEEVQLMLENYLPKDLADFSLDAALQFVDNYLQNQVVVLKCKFEKVYNQSLYDYARKLLESDGGKCTSSVLKLLRKLPVDERQAQVKALMEHLGEGSSLRDVLVSFSSTSEAMPYFKSKIVNASSADERARLLSSMIVCCGVENNGQELRNVLRYYRENHGNEASLSLYSFFEYLVSEFQLNALDEVHWSSLRDIIKDARARGELYKSHVTLIETVLEAMLRHALTRQKRDERMVEETIDTIVECKMENFSPNWRVMKDIPVLEKDCLEKFFLLIPLKYPLETHSIWKRDNDRLALALSLLKTIKTYNEGSKSEVIRLRDYPWMSKLAEDLVAERRTDMGFRRALLGKLLCKLSAEVYEAALNRMENAVRDLGSGEALRLLRSQPERVLSNWPSYLDEARRILSQRESTRASLDRAREKLRVKSFVAATSWHQELPLRFVEDCLEKLRHPGSLAILGILLPGESFESASSAFAPNRSDGRPTKENFEMWRTLLDGLRWTNPPVSVASLRPFCRVDCVNLAEGTLSSLARRVRADRALDLAKWLSGRPQASLMKRGLGLARCVATRRQFRDLLAEYWSNCKDAPKRKLLAKWTFEAFVESPLDAWPLMRDCLRALTPDDREAVQDLSEIDRVDANLLSDYVHEYLDKVEQLFASSLDFSWRTRCVCLLVESLDEEATRRLSEEASRRIVDRYFFDADCSEISRVARTFAVRHYLLGAAGDSERFDARLKVVMDVLKRTMESFDAPHPKRPRHYPANYCLQEFFGGLLSELSASLISREDKLRIVESTLRVFEKSLSPCQDGSSYLALSLYREYLQSTSAEDFGSRAAKKIESLLEDLSGSSEPIADIAECLNDFVFNKIRFGDSPDSPYSSKLAMMEGLVRGDEHYGALTAVKLLEAREVSEYDDRYDQLVGNLRRVNNSSIRYNLYRHLNSLTE